MEKTLKNYKEKANKEILEEMASLKEEFDKTKSLIFNLTHHLDSVEDEYNKLNNEIKTRKGDAK
jgi:DNA anti-recombination protein RmuC|tara:strand:- start:4628 stop:4819 length:192 start_codon:yes stop_codon:yes gene_type:complete